ncbi:MAG: hypothetical protein HFG52_12990 [Lachnospiraceae bacterium]|nr:hypothetical protein [Lachnospiraceae bacterium]
MTNGLIGDIVVTVNKKRTDTSGKETIMATVNFATNAFAYYLHSEHYEALFSKEKEQSLVKMRSCKVMDHSTPWMGMPSGEGSGL